MKYTDEQLADFAYQFTYPIDGRRGSWTPAEAIERGKMIVGMARRGLVDLPVADTPPTNEDR